jgi:phosphate starvation-inducible PhoH-like protein
MRFRKIAILLTPLLLASRAFSFQTVPRIGSNVRTYSSVSELKMRAKKSSISNEVGAIRHMAPTYRPKTLNQELYVKYLADINTPIVLGVGPAGCGKTLFACITAIQELRKGNIQKIILTRPIVPVEDEELGFLPGDMIQKMAPWTRPIFDIFLEFYQQKDLDAMLVSGVIEISPLAFMRGRTFKRSFIVADEMQNSTPNQMLMLTTRIGEGTKMVITGDLKQSDRCADNGLLDIMNKVRRYYDRESYDDNGEVSVRMVELEVKDVERSPIVSKILDIYTEPVIVSTKKLVAGSLNNATLFFENDAAMIPLSTRSS